MVLEGNYIQLLTILCRMPSCSKRNGISFSHWCWVQLERLYTVLGQQAAFVKEQWMLLPTPFVLANGLAPQTSITAFHIFRYSAGA